MVYYNEDGSVTSNAAPRTLIGDNAIIAAKDAEIARLTADLRHVMSERDRTFALMLDRAEKAEAERDEARAQVAMAFEVAAKELDTHGDSAATNALGQRLCCSGEMCGCRGADVGSFLQYLIRAITPADATAALAARDAAMRNEGRRQGQPCTTDHFLRLLWDVEIMSDYAKVCRVGDWLSGDFDAALRDLEPEGVE